MNKTHLVMLDPLKTISGHLLPLFVSTDPEFGVDLFLGYYFALKYVSHE